MDFETDNLLFVVPVDDVVAVFRRPRPERPKSDPSNLVEDADSEDTDDSTDSDEAI